MSRILARNLRGPIAGAALAAAASAIAVSSCGDTTTTPLNQLNLDRPVDVAFACYGEMRVTGGGGGSETDPIVKSAMPSAACDALSPLSGSGAGTPVTGQGALGGVQPVPAWYAFILQSAAGTVAIATWPVKPIVNILPGVSDIAGDFHVLDADPLTPGKNAIAIGEDPVAIATDKAGCFEVTANAGSCDLSELEINSALNGIGLGGGGTKASQVRVDRVTVHNAGGGAILARPSAMIGEAATGAVGVACPTTATGRVYIAYPSCHMVAGVDVATGEIKSAIRFDPAGVATALTGTALAGVTCPAECTAPRGVAVASTPASPGVRPVSLAYRLDPRAGVNTSKLAIGAENSHTLTVVDLAIDTFDPTTVLQIPLEDTTTGQTLGVTQVAMSPQIGMGGNAAGGGSEADFKLEPGDQAQFVYAIATDNTVRVAELIDQKRECDTQIDSRFLEGFRDKADVKTTKCLPIGDPTLPRRSGAIGPGIELPDNSAPTSVAITHGAFVPALAGGSGSGSALPVAPDPSILVGHFAVITASTGAAYVVNIDDDYAPDAFDEGNPFGTAPVLTFAHQLRDGFVNRDAGAQGISGTGSAATNVPACLPAIPLGTGGAFSGGPRTAAAPSPTPPTGMSADLDVVLPRLQSLVCKQDFDAKEPGIPLSTLQLGTSAQVRHQVFPDLRAIQNEAWRLTYEGGLSLDSSTVAIDGPVIREATIQVDKFGMRITDRTGPFCEMGAEIGDIAELRGCNPANLDKDCPANYTCFVHPKSVVPIGACMLKSEAPRLTDACVDFLSTLRRYTVGPSAGGNVEAGKLALFERKRVLPQTPIDGCTDDAQCVDLAQLGDKLSDSADATYTVPKTGTPGTLYRCEVDKLRPPFDANNPFKRCVQHCSSDPSAPAVCPTGTVCRTDPGATEGVCLEGVEPPQACVNGPQRYDVRGGEAFVLVGARSGYIHPFKADANGACVRDPAASPTQVGRIPLKVPACDPMANPITGKKMDGTFDANPCSVEVNQAETLPQYMPEVPDPEHPEKPPVCAKAASTDALTVHKLPAIQLRTRSMKLTLVDPTYPGDVCFRDRLGGLIGVPYVTTGFQIDFEQKGGFLPYSLPLVGQVFPTRVVRGPSESIWVIDAGDFLSSSIGDSSTRGRVFRIEPQDSVVNTLQ
jgi:hypothetical protein